MITWILNWYKLWQHRRKYKLQRERMQQQDPFPQNGVTSDD
jgi:hypothetical protein